MMSIDCNAVVGQEAEHDDPRIVGTFCVGARTQRGRLLVAWAHSMELTIMNTMFCKRFENQWTHKSKSGVTLRQIDYVLTDAALHSSITNAEAVDDLTYLTDHRAVWAKLGRNRRKRKKCRPPWHARSWTAQGGFDSYHQALSAEIVALPSVNAESITHVVVKTAMSQGSAPKKLKIEDNADVVELRRQRRAATGTIDRADLSKKLACSVRKQRRERHDQALDDLIQRAQAGEKLKRLKRQGGQRCIASAKDSTGTMRANRMGIAEVFAKFYEALYAPHADEVNTTLADEAFDIKVTQVREMLENTSKLMKKNQDMRRRWAGCGNATEWM